VQDIEYEKLRGQLLKDAQVLEYGKPRVSLLPQPRLDV
jgi:hypothetical protein